MFLSEDFRLKVGLAEMLKGGVIMDVTNAEQARIAEDAGACAVDAVGNKAVLPPARSALRPLVIGQAAQPFDKVIAALASGARRAGREFIFHRQFPCGCS